MKAGSRHECQNTAELNYRYLSHRWETQGEISISDLVISFNVYLTEYGLYYLLEFI